MGIDASCKYDPEVKVDAKFWVNQEDVFMDIAEEGKLDELFSCKFFEDATRKNEIKSHNIVNMGEMLYGEVDSDTVLFGLGYELTGVVVSDPKDAANTFDVVDNVPPSTTQSAQQTANNRLVPTFSSSTCHSVSRPTACQMATKTNSRSNARLTCLLKS